MSTKLGRLLLLCDQTLLDMRHLTTKVETLQQCYGDGIEGQAGTADLSDHEIALIQQVNLMSSIVLNKTCCRLLSCRAERGPSDLAAPAYRNALQPSASDCRVTSMDLLCSRYF